MSDTNKKSGHPIRMKHLRAFILIVLATVLLAGAGAAVYVMTAILPKVPPIDAVTDYRPKIPLRIYTADNVLIGQFGVEHRDFVPIAKIPPMMKSAVLAIEDTRFYEHGGIDFIRALGAARANLRGGFRQGASTITMQVARNFFLTNEKTIARKLTEIALAYKIEDSLTKDQILELYMNQIYLGQRSYGFSSAARSYFGKTLDQLTLAETAMLAGLPQNPARTNPVSNPKRAQARQHAILKRLLELGEIDEARYRQALAEPLRVKHDAGQSFDTRAEYVAELARQAVYQQFGEESYTRGITVTTTILAAEQNAAYDSVRRNVLAYDQRHGYRGPEARIVLPLEAEEREEAIVDALQKRPGSDGLLPAVVLEASAQEVLVDTLEGEEVAIRGAGLRFAANALSAKARENVRITPGAIVRISKGKDGDWAITQVPQVAAAFVAIDADTGAYHALVGGFDYNLQKFNHVTQAWRQPGSSIKPFVYSAALEKGYSPTTRILDEPIELPGATLDTPWTPQNDDGVFDGEVTLRQALVKSKNVPTVRVLRAVSVDFAHQYLEHFGFDLARHPKNYTMALGTGAVTPLQLAGGYAVFANGGYRVKPYLISRIQDGNGAVILATAPPQAKNEANRAITARNAFVVDSMLRDVARFGTAAGATRQLGRQDLAGKTGTTNDAVDGWFAGYAGNVVAVSWMGYDEPRSLGGREFGSTLAMPIWIDYMRAALAKAPPVERTPPEDVVHDGEDWIYPEFIDAGETRTIDIEQAPVEQPLDIPPGSQEVPPDASPFDERPAIEALPQVAPQVGPPLAPAPAPAAGPAPSNPPPAQNPMW
ncbi:1A family penicillin-binding protein [Massilia timonae CCUG 45783]|uniref:Penicillin-binding protein 1A n=2 Tax=Massilia timonae TaxID=47229 RepID=K9DAA4_9BURK|nr:1A family penicillin-binding protein [Massilia timonae CCUG 45783]